MRELDDNGDDNIRHHALTPATAYNLLTTASGTRARRSFRLKNGRSCWHSALGELGELATGLRTRIGLMSGHEPERMTAAMVDALGRRLGMPRVLMSATIRPADDAPGPFHPEAPPGSQPPKNSGLGRNMNNINHLP